MTNDERDEYVLGQDVTQAAESKARSASTVLSVRLTTDELAAIETVASQTGKSLSQVVREAVRNCLQSVGQLSEPRRSVMVSVSGTRTTSFYGPTPVETVGNSCAPEAGFYQIGTAQLATT